MIATVAIDRPSRPSKTNEDSPQKGLHPRKQAAWSKPSWDRTRLRQRRNGRRRRSEERNWRDCGPWSTSMSADNRRQMERPTPPFVDPKDKRLRRWHFGGMKRLFMAEDSPPGCLSLLTFCAQMHKSRPRRRHGLARRGNGLWPPRRTQGRARLQRKPSSRLAFAQSCLSPPRSSITRQRKNPADVFRNTTSFFIPLVLALGSGQIRTKCVEGEDFAIQTVFTEGSFLSSGILDFPPKSIKPPRNSSKHVLVSFLLPLHYHFRIF